MLFCRISQVLEKYRLTVVLKESQSVHLNLNSNAEIRSCKGADRHSNLWAQKAVGPPRSDGVMFGAQTNTQIFSKINRCENNRNRSHGISSSFVCLLWTLLSFMMAKINNNEHIFITFGLSDMLLYKMWFTWKLITFPSAAWKWNDIYRGDRTKRQTCWHLWMCAHVIFEVNLCFTFKIKVKMRRVCAQFLGRAACRWLEKQNVYREQRETCMPISFIDTVLDFLARSLNNVWPCGVKLMFCYYREMESIAQP